MLEGFPRDLLYHEAAWQVSILPFHHSRCQKAHCLHINYEGPTIFAAAPQAVPATLASQSAGGDAAAEAAAATAEADAVSAWFSAAVGTNCSLVRQQEGARTAFHTRRRHSQDSAPGDQAETLPETIGALSNLPLSPALGNPWLLGDLPAWESCGNICKAKSICCRHAHTACFILRHLIEGQPAHAVSAVKL